MRNFQVKLKLWRKLKWKGQLWNCKTCGDAGSIYQSLEIPKSVTGGKISQSLKCSRILLSHSSSVMCHSWFIGLDGNHLLSRTRKWWISVSVSLSLHSSSSLLSCLPYASAPLSPPPPPMWNWPWESCSSVPEGDWCECVSVSVCV